MAVNGAMTLVLDGRLDDRATLADRIGTSRQHSDEQLILLAWRKWGECVPEYLLGDFALIVADSEKQTVFCARDHMGVRPLFYAVSGNRFAVGSTIQQVLDAPFIDAALDMDVVASKIAKSMMPLPDRTYFRHVRKLLPGHSLRASAEGVVIQRYWKPQNAASIHFAKDEDYADALRGLIEKAVADRTPRDGPLGVHVSGGLDCGVVAAVATNIRRKTAAPDPIGFSWSPPQTTTQSDFEQRLVDAVADHLRIDVKQPGFAPDLLMNLLRTDGLFAPTAANLFHELPVQHAAQKQSIEVILSGWGGDDAASHNGRLARADLLFSMHWREFVKDARADNLGAVRAAAIIIRNRFGNIASTQAKRFESPPVGYLNPSLQKRSRKYERAVLQASSNRALMEKLLTSGHLTMRIEDWAQSGLDHGVEYRYPLLDRRVLDFALGVPSRLFRKGGVNRWLMRSAVAPLLPREITWNQSKLELGRVEYLVNAANQMLPDFISALGPLRHDSARDEWFDMGAIRNRLREGLPLHKPKASSLFGALQLLDWQA
ncbi:hypothetical protein NYA22BAC_00943 [Parasphingorhabdus sp. NYA22]